MHGKLGVFIIGLSSAVRFPQTDKRMITTSTIFLKKDIIIICENLNLII